MSNNTIQIENPNAVTVTSPTGARVVIREPAAPDVVVIQGAGAQGPAGPAGDVADQIRTYVADTAVGSGRIVRSSTVTDVEHADSSDAGNMHNTLGLSLQAVSGGANVQVLIEGQYTELSWTWTVGDPLFFNTSGVLTQTAPASGFYQKVGHALTATTAFIRIHEPIRR